MLELLLEPFVRDFFCFGFVEGLEALGGGVWEVVLLTFGGRPRLLTSGGGDGKVSGFLDLVFVSTLGRDGRRLAVSLY
jgi:hypothetical protein